MDATAFLEDLERRIDPEEEQRLIEEWKLFLGGTLRHGVFSPRRRPAAADGLSWPAPRVNEAIDDTTFGTMLVQQLKNVHGVITGIDGAIPMIRANFGCTIIPTMFGCQLQMMAPELDTLPAALPLAGGLDGIRRLIKKGIPDLRGGQGAAVFDASAYFAATLARYPKLSRYVRIYHPDFQGVLDIAEILCGSEIFLWLYDEPELMRDLFALIAETYIAVMEHYLALVPPDPEGYAWHYGWMHRGRIRLSLDSCMNFPPEVYRDFVLPYDRMLLDRFGGIVHSCGRVEHFVGLLPELGPGYHGFNMGQPEYNRLETVFDATIRRGIPVFQLPEHFVRAALDQGADLNGLVHVPPVG